MFKLPSDLDSAFGNADALCDSSVTFCDSGPGRIDQLDQALRSTVVRIIEVREKLEISARRAARAPVT